MTCKKRYDNLSKNRGNCFKCSETTTEEIKMKVFDKNVVGRVLQQYQKILFLRQSLSFSILSHRNSF